MVNSTKLFLTLFLISLVTAIAQNITSDDQGRLFSVIDSKTEETHVTSDIYNEGQTVPTQTNSVPQYQFSILDAVKSGGKLIGLMLTTLWPWGSFQAAMAAESYLEMIVNSIITLFRVMMDVIIGVEAYKLFINKKAD